MLATPLRITPTPIEPINLDNSSIRGACTFDGRQVLVSLLVENPPKKWGARNYQALVHRLSTVPEEL
jgi:hypothetical protein